MNDTIKPQSPLPTIGAKVIPLPDLDGEWHYLDEWYRDKTGTVTSFRSDGFGRHIITAEFQSRMKPEDTIAWDFYEWKPADTGVIVETDIVPAPRQEEIDTLKRELERANERVEEFRNRASMWQRDFTKYADRILQEAVEREWCEEYERVMQSIQNILEIAVIPEREQEFEVEVEVTGTLTTTTTVTVTARSQEDADEMVNENMDDYVDADDILTNAARHRSFDNIECNVE